MIATAEPQTVPVVQTQAEAFVVIKGEWYHLQVELMGQSYRLMKMGTTAVRTVRDYGPDGWKCSCPSRGFGRSLCRHISGLMETGHISP